MRSGTLRKKANLILIQLALASALLFGIAAFAIAKFYKYLDFIAKSLLGQFKTLCGCQIPLSFTNHPYLISGVFILALAIIAALLAFLVKSIHIYNRTGAFIKKYIRHGRSASEKLIHIAKQINLQDRVLEINSPEPAVFCYGFLQPRICISSEIINSLTCNELRAVLLHEQHHMQVYEPLRLLLVKIIASALFFIPGIKSLASQYGIFSELAADETATDNFQNKGPLAQALNKILAKKENLTVQKGLAVSFFSHIIEERVNKLVDENYIPASKTNIIKIISSVFALGIIFVTAKSLRPSYLPTANEISHCALAEQNEINKNNLWITSALTNKSLPTTICSRYIKQ